MIKPKLITIERVEGLIEECVTKTATSWAEANAILLKWSRTAPEHGGYDKCDFKIVFEDGYEYEGRYDLMHYRRERPDLGKHVRDFVSYHAGKLPGWCRKPEDVERVTKHQNSLGDETRANAVKWLKTYETT